MLKSFKKAIGMNKKASVPEKKEVQVQVEVQDVDNTINAGAMSVQQRYQR